MLPEVVDGELLPETRLQHLNTLKMNIYLLCQFLETFEALATKPTTDATAKVSLTGRVPWQGLSQDLETGCPKLSTVRFLGVLFIKGDHNKLIFIAEIWIQPIYLIEIRHNIVIQCQGICI